VPTKSKTLAVAVITCLLLTSTAPLALAKGRTPGVEVRARVGGQILLEIADGEEISFEVDPLLNPEDTASTELIVRTNALHYSIVAQFSDFSIGEYDLIEHEKFFIRSTAPGTGEAINDWTVPKGEMVILKNENGLTPGETIVVEYLLKVDFTVPPGEGRLQVIYTAVPAF